MMDKSNIRNTAMKRQEIMTKETDEEIKIVTKCKCDCEKEDEGTCEKDCECCTDCSCLI